MPLHGVGLIVGGTIAVLGSGYVFKKYIYDPHLGPYIEALLAQHHFLHADPPRSHRHSDAADEAIPVAVSARTTAREIGGTKLRRRSKRSSDGEDMEMREGLLRAEEREEQYMLREGPGDHAEVYRPGEQNPYRHGAREDEVRSPHIRNSSTHTPHPDLIDLHVDPAISAQDAEVRSVIFNYPSPPLTRSSTPSIRLAAEPFPSIHTVAAPPSLHLSPRGEYLGSGDDRLGNAGLGAGVASTTFSFLSLSQASSPEVPTRMLDSWTSTAAEGSMPRALATEGDEGEEREKDDERILDMEDDLISHPGTAVSDYIDAETYTPYGERSISPSYPAFPDLPDHGQSSSSSSSRPGDSGGEAPRKDDDVERVRREMIPEDLGLSFVRLRSLNQSPPAGRDRRGPMSVVSLSESDEGGSEEWEAL